MQENYALIRCNAVRPNNCAVHSSARRVGRRCRSCPKLRAHFPASSSSYQPRHPQQRVAGIHHLATIASAAAPLQFILSYFKLSAHFPACRASKQPWLPRKHATFKNHPAFVVVNDVTSSGSLSPGLGTLSINTVQNTLPLSPNLTSVHYQLKKLLGFLVRRASAACYPRHCV